MSGQPTSASATGEVAFQAAKARLVQAARVTERAADVYTALVLGAAMPIIAAGYRTEMEAAVGESMATITASMEQLVAAETADLRTQLAAAERDRDRLQALVDAFNPPSISAVKGMWIRPDGDGLRLATDHRLGGDMLQALIDWCAANGIDAAKVPGQSTLQITDDMIEFEECREVIGPNGEKGFRSDLPRIKRKVPLVVPIPSEWIWRARG